MIFLQKAVLCTLLIIMVYAYIFESFTKKVFEYLTEKGIDKSRIIQNYNESFLAEGKSYPSNVLQDTWLRMILR